MEAAAAFGCQAAAAAADDDDDDVQWFNLHLKARSHLSLAHSAKVKTDLPERKTAIQCVECVRWVEM